MEICGDLHLNNVIVALDATPYLGDPDQQYRTEDNLRDLNKVRLYIVKPSCMDFKKSAMLALLSAYNNRNGLFCFICESVGRG